MADFTVSSMFSDNMVLQREKPITVWGSGIKGSKVFISLDNQKKEGLVDDSGNWKFVLEPMKTGGPYTLQIESEEKKVEYKNVMLGEVWLCSGQSNMQFKTIDVFNSEKAINEASQYPDIRLYFVPKAGVDKPLQKLDAHWQICNGESIKDFSAVAYFFARNLKNNPELKNIPVGLIDSSFGGTVVEAWMSADFLSKKFPNEELQNSLFGFKPSYMFNAMISPLIPYSIKGVVWYQGESNCNKPEQYGRLFPGMIEHWRSLWNEPALPLIFVQIPNYSDKFIGRYFTGLREVQQQISEKIPAVWMAVSIDVGDSFDVHPRNKQDVGYRLALLARNKIYGENIVCMGPVYKSHRIAGSSVEIEYENAKNGLKSKYPNVLRGFALCGEDGVFWYADAKIESNKIILNCPKAPSPVHIRYAWEGDPHAELYNAEGLPALPFRTDNFPEVKEEIEISPIPQSRKVATANYEALIDGNGCLRSLKIKGEEFLDYEVSPDSPACFFPSFWGPLKLMYITELSPRHLFAEVDSASILFEFKEDSIELSLINKTAQDSSFLMIFSNKIKSAKTSKETSIQTLPYKGSDNIIIISADKSSLEITCDAEASFDAYGSKKSQSCEIKFKPGEKRKIKLSIKQISDTQKNKNSETGK